MSIEKLTDGGMEIWASATNLTHWEEGISGTSTVNREATEKIEGDYSCRFDVDASNNDVYIYQNLTMIPLKKYKLIIWYKNSVLGKTAKFILRDSGTNVSLKEDGTWQAGAYYIEFPNSTIWKKFELEFNAHADYSNYVFLLRNSSAASSSIYFDDVSILDPVDYTRDGVFLGTGTRIV